MKALNLISAALTSRLGMVALLVLCAAVSLAFGHQVQAGDGLMLIGMAAAAPVTTPLPWRRIRDLPFTITPAPAAGTTVFIKIPRWDRTLLRILLQLGGTTFPKSYITEWRLKLGSKLISRGTGTHLQKINSYHALPDNSAFLSIDFTDSKNKLLSGEFVGGIYMTALPDGDVNLEVDISASASAPTLTAFATWGEPQKNAIIKRLLQFTGSFGTTGRNGLNLDFQGADVARLYLMYGVADAATSTAWASNTGNGAMGTVTVSAGAKIGTYKLRIVEPGTNVGTFIIQDPDGIELSKSGVVASAYSYGGLAFTLADGATDFVSGDGFDIVVRAASGNINRAVVTKDGLVIYDRTDVQAMYEQTEYGFKPQFGMFVVDFTVDKSPIGIVTTADAKSLIEDFYATATDTFTLYAECYQDLLKSNLASQ